MSSFRIITFMAQEVQGLAERGELSEAGLRALNGYLALLEAAAAEQRGQETLPGL